LGIPDYFNVIKEPMDLTTIYNNIKNGYYENNITFEKDLKKIWENALIYNQ
tara:strand:+ start:435 stop:587 length:153 start_codon:yes stop_codon:yes gene_type:complete